MFTLEEAEAYLDSHINYEKAASRRDTPTMERMEALCALMGDPQTVYPVLHVTGTNGKGSTVRMASALLAAHGLTVGTYTSPHLQQLNERLVLTGMPIADDALAALLYDVSLYEEHLALRLTHFEVLTAAALRWFADQAVDIAVLEVGLGGRWDSTNIANAAVAVVTNVGLDHAEVIGPTTAEIADEKSGIIKPGSRVVLGETSPDLVPIFAARPSAGVWQRDLDFACTANDLALGGRMLDLSTPLESVEDVWVPLHGPHQGDNAACALAAVTAFFDRPLDEAVVRDAFASVSVPGRFEVVRRHPLVVLDGAHNPDGARALAATLRSDFSGQSPDVTVFGLTGVKDPSEMLSLMGIKGHVVACAPNHPRAVPADQVAAAAQALGATVSTAPTAAAAVAQAMEMVTDFALVTGSLYLVGEVRGVLGTG